MLKNAYFLEKTVKNRPVCLRRLGAPPSDPRVVIPTYYYNFVEFISSAKARSTLGVQNFFRPRTSVDKRPHKAILHYERTGVTT